MGIRTTGQTTVICDLCGKEEVVGPRVLDVPRGWHSIPLDIDDSEHDGPTRLCGFACLGAWAADQSAAAEAAAAQADVSDDEGVEA